MGRQQRPARGGAAAAAPVTSTADDELDLQAFSESLHPMGLTIRDVADDGNCFFRAVSDQLYGSEQFHNKLRQRACDYLIRNKHRYQFFVDDEQSFDEHVADMRNNGVWADNLELQAISMACGVNIRIHQSGNPSYDIRNHPAPDAPVIHLSYHFGEHYASVRPLRTANIAVPAQHVSLPPSLPRLSSTYSNTTAAPSSIPSRHVSTPSPQIITSTKSSSSIASPSTLAVQQSHLMASSKSISAAGPAPPVQQPVQVHPQHPYGQMNSALVSPSVSSQSSASSPRRPRRSIGGNGVMAPAPNVVSVGGGEGGGGGGGGPRGIENEGIWRYLLNRHEELMHMCEQTRKSAKTIRLKQRTEDHAERAQAARAIERDMREVHGRLDRIGQTIHMNLGLFGPNDLQISKLSINSPNSNNVISPSPPNQSSPLSRNNSNVNMNTMSAPHHAGLPLDAVAASPKRVGQDTTKSRDDIVRELRKKTDPVRTALDESNDSVAGAMERLHELRKLIEHEESNDHYRVTGGGGASDPHHAHTRTMSQSKSEKQSRLHHRQQRQQAQQQHQPSPQPEAEQSQEQHQQESPRVMAKGGKKKEQDLKKKERKQRRRREQERRAAAGLDFDGMTRQHMPARQEDMNIAAI